jgi:hypothetical protein
VTRQARLQRHRSERPYPARVGTFILSCHWSQKVERAGNSEGSRAGSRREGALAANNFGKNCWRRFGKSGVCGITGRSYENRTKPKLKD